MLTYNTRRKQLVLPEYGRNLQRMVDYACTLENRDERNACARTIIRTMETLFPELKQPENSHKVWDHLSIMSDFKLDIDYPEGVVKAEELDTKPQEVPYTQSKINHRHYGKILEEMIEKAAGMAPGEARDEVVLLLANQMKKMMLAVNSDGVDDRRIFADLAAISHGEIRLDPETTHLNEYREIPQPQGKKKKKRK